MMRSYYLRIGLISLVLALLTAGLIWRAVADSSIRILASAPNGDAVSVGTTIRLTFSTDVDRRSAEQQFALSPPAPGRFFWEDRTMVFEPGQALDAATEYRVTLLAGVRDIGGRVSGEEQGWTFRTRSQRLLALRDAANGSAEIWSVLPDGSNAQLIFSAAQGINSIAVDSSGDYLVYVEPRGSERTALMLLDLADGSTRPLVDTPEASVSGAQWSPNGEFIVFERRALVNGALGVPRLWLTQPDGTLLGPLFSGDGSDISYAAAWAPDGNRIAFLDGSSLEILLYDFLAIAASRWAIVARRRSVGCPMAVAWCMPARNRRAARRCYACVATTCNSSSAPISPMVMVVRGAPLWLRTAARSLLAAATAPRPQCKSGSHPPSAARRAALPQTVIIRIHSRFGRPMARSLPSCAAVSAASPRAAPGHRPRRRRTAPSPRKRHPARVGTVGAEHAAPRLRLCCAQVDGAQSACPQRIVLRSRVWMGFLNPDPCAHASSFARPWLEAPRLQSKARRFSLPVLVQHFLQCSFFGNILCKVSQFLLCYAYATCTADRATTRASDTSRRARRAFVARRSAGRIVLVGQRGCSARRGTRGERCAPGAEARFPWLPRATGYPARRGDHGSKTGRARASAPGPGRRRQFTGRYRRRRDRRPAGTGPPCLARSARRCRPVAVQCPPRGSVRFRPRHRPRRLDGSAAAPLGVRHAGAARQCSRTRRTPARLRCGGCLASFCLSQPPNTPGATAAVCRRAAHACGADQRHHRPVSPPTAAPVAVRTTWHLRGLSDTHRADGDLQCPRSYPRPPGQRAFAQLAPPPGNAARSISR
ncbi:hypothetical protein HC891_16695 [Candidatus Gracilibacteria bacterium]|nr:hypothetical protein [Candidatus Gracilibacteria bacterium]